MHGKSVLLLFSSGLVLTFGGSTVLVKVLSGRDSLLLSESELLGGFKLLLEGLHLLGLTIGLDG